MSAQEPTIILDPAYTATLGKLIERDFPRTWALFVEGRDAQE